MTDLFRKIWDCVVTDGVGYSETFDPEDLSAYGFGEHELEQLGFLKGIVSDLNDIDSIDAGLTLSSSGALNLSVRRGPVQHDIQMMIESQDFTDSWTKDSFYMGPVHDGVHGYVSFPEDNYF
ncbi:MAG: hypothetical protein AAGB32_06190 [Pseudomonadota bacterium]